jgi:hypothetical protein
VLLLEKDAKKNIWTNENERKMRAVNIIKRGAA